jgi:O-antigen/teichoic acid export membrane protein
MTVGYVCSQVIRLGGNLVFTRLLFPEAFGLMALVQAVLTGLTMLSDVGADQAIVQNRDGDAAAFANTAWTMKIIRGILISAITFILAVPISELYREPTLAQLLPIAGVSAVIGGFASTNIALADRHLRLARATLIEIGSSLVTVVATIALALLYRSIWALVVGSIFGVAARTCASHWWLGGVKNRFQWDRQSLKALTTFGRWIFLSSALTFLVGQGNRLLVGTLLDMRMLAFFTLATAIVQLPAQFLQQVGGRILFSAYSEIVRERPQNLFPVLTKSRLVQILPFWLMCALLVFSGDWLVRILYDDRYREAGWVLQVLSLGSLVGCISTSYGGVLMAKGLVGTSTFLLIGQCAAQITAIVLGHLIGGERGIIIALGLVSLAFYPVHAAVYARLSLWQPRIDIPMLGLSVLVILSTAGRLFSTG